MAGAAPATAAAGATRCARSTCSKLESDAGFDAIKAAYRRLAKANHPDAEPGDTEAAARFQPVQAAYEVLRKAEERRGKRLGSRAVDTPRSRPGATTL